MFAIELGFWISAALIIYAYAGYPAILWVVALIRPRPVLKSGVTPTVTFVITAYNEEKRIGEKLKNTLELDYPGELIDVLVASDCSSDQTDDIVRSYQDQGIELIRAPARRGKEAAQKLAVDAAGGEVLVFSDVATILPREAISNIVRNFSDPSVGCVSSTDRFIDQDGRVSGEGAYVRYEMLLRSLETRVNSLVGLSGSFFAARSAVCLVIAQEPARCLFGHAIVEECAAQKVAAIGNLRMVWIGLDIGCELLACFGIKARIP